MSIQVGDKAPEFALYDSGKNLVNLSDFKEKNVVLLFFPLAFTGTCTTELCNMRDDIGRYAALNAEVLAVSVDTPFSLGQFKEKYNFNFSLLSDFNKEISRAYGAQYDVFVLDLKGVAKRSAFVIDKNGIVKYAEVLENPSHLPNFEAVQEALSKLN